MAEEASPPPPPPPPPPPAAKAGVSQGAVLSAIRNVANVPSLITSLIIRASCFRMRAIPPAGRVNSALPETFPPERFFQLSKWNANKRGRRRPTIRHHINISSMGSNGTWAFGRAVCISRTEGVTVTLSFFGQQQASFR